MFSFSNNKGAATIEIAIIFPIVIGIILVFLNLSFDMFKEIYLESYLEKALVELKENYYGKLEKNTWDKSIYRSITQINNRGEEEKIKGFVDNYLEENMHLKDTIFLKELISNISVKSNLASKEITVEIVENSKELFNTDEIFKYDKEIKVNKSITLINKTEFIRNTDLAEEILMSFDVFSEAVEKVKEIKEKLYKRIDGVSE